MSIQHLNLPYDKVNPVGGAIAMGHPLGATGARQVATALAEAKREKKKIFVTSMCIGSGMVSCRSVAQRCVANLRRAWRLCLSTSSRQYMYSQLTTIERKNELCFANSMARPVSDPVDHTVDRSLRQTCMRGYSLPTNFQTL